MRVLLTIVLLLTGTTAHAKLRFVYVSTVMLPPEAPERIFARIVGFDDGLFGVSNDCGVSFREAVPGDIPSTARTVKTDPGDGFPRSHTPVVQESAAAGGGLREGQEPVPIVLFSHGSRQYLLLNQVHLLSSEDGGNRWVRTGLARLIRERAQRAAAAAEADYLARYGSRLPPQGSPWRCLLYTSDAADECVNV